jgi:uncharacterized protein YjlB
MSGQEQLFSANLARNAVYKTGLRSFMEYRDLGIKFVHEGHGEHTFGKGDCILQPPGIVHNELDCSDDVEILEIYSPAVHETVVVGRVPEAAAAR